jgi:hypothetical protein
VPGFTGQDR